MATNQISTNLIWLAIMIVIQCGNEASFSAISFTYNNHHEPILVGSTESINSDETRRQTESIDQTTGTIRFKEIDLANQPIANQQYQQINTNFILDDNAQSTMSPHQTIKVDMMKRTAEQTNNNNQTLPYELLNDVWRSSSTTTTRAQYDQIPPPFLLTQDL